MRTQTAGCLPAIFRRGQQRPRSPSFLFFIRAPRLVRLLLLFLGMGEGRRQRHGRHTTEGANRRSMLTRGLLLLFITNNQSRTSLAAIAQLGERQTEDLKVPGSIPGLGMPRQRGSANALYINCLKIFSTVYINLLISHARTLSDTQQRGRIDVRCSQGDYCCSS